MTDHPNVTLVRRGFEAFNAGDVVSLTELIATDAIQHMPGDNQLSGEHKGRDSILTMYGQMAQLTDGTLRIDLEHVYANDHRAVAVYRGHGTRRGRVIEERHALVFEILDGKAIDIDDIALEGRVDDAFWA
jgi:hypothetical protein